VKPWERWTFGLLALIVSATGGAYFWMKYMIVNTDPFAVVNHPWQAAMLAAHLVAAPGLLLMFGIVLNSHILRKLGATTRLPNRKSGYLSLATFFTMTLTGYLLQVVTAEQTLQVLVALHVTTGALFSIAYVTHLLISVRLARAYREARVRIEAV
jgi:hypothetical protein